MSQWVVLALVKCDEPLVKQDKPIKLKPDKFEKKIDISNTEEVFDNPEELELVIDVKFNRKKGVKSKY